MSDQQSIMNSLKDKGPETWRAYLRTFEKGAPLAGLSMDVIFHYAAVLADKQNSMDWAEVAVRAAELEARNSSGVERENALLRAMNLRSRFIARIGAHAGHWVLDRSIILDWVVGGLRLPLLTVKEKAASLPEKLAHLKALSNPEEKQRVSQDLHELRWIKHRLNAVKVLADSGELPENSILNEWLELREQLP